NALPDAEFPNFIWSQGLAYDGAGNTTHSWTHRSEGTGGSAHVFESSRSYYDAAGRLRVTNRQLGLGPGTSPGGVWEEYRYDALGRRVLVRSRGLAMTGAQQGDNGPWSYIERTVWDGDRIVAELRGNGATNATHSDLERATPGSGSSTNAPFGRVQYVHALGTAASGGIRMPVLDQRSGVYTGTVVFAPLTNWRGQLQAAVVASGTMPAVTWPGARLTLDGAPVSAPSGSYFWMGNLADQITDGSGLQYRRNRYYDPQTGRFTQSDPIGIAGGINLYGFAGGDPVNFADPFGLKVCFRGTRSEVRSLAFTAKAATNSTFTLDSDNCVEDSSFRSPGNSNFDELRTLFGEFVGSDYTFTAEYSRDAFSRQEPFRILLGRNTED